MYIIREINTKKILAMDHFAKSNADPKDIYPEYDAKTMELGWTSSELPAYFKIDKGKIKELTLKEKVEQGIISILPTQKIKDNQIIEKTLKEKVKEGLFHLSPAQKIENNEIKLKTYKELVEDGLMTVDEPFQYLDGNERKTRTIEELIRKDLLETAEHCEKALSIQSEEIEKKIAVKYSKGKEIKVIKNFLEWLEQGKPEKDDRELEYCEMKRYIYAIKEDYKPAREKLKDLLDKYTK